MSIVYTIFLLNQMFEFFYIVLAIVDNFRKKLKSNFQDRTEVILQKANSLAGSVSGTPIIDNNVLDEVKFCLVALRI